MTDDEKKINADLQALKKQVSKLTYDFNVTKADTIAMFNGFGKITVGQIPPQNPSLNDLWIDTN